MPARLIVASVSSKRSYRAIGSVVDVELGVGVGLERGQARRERGRRDRRAVEPQRAIGGEIELVDDGVLRRRTEPGCGRSIGTLLVMAGMVRIIMTSSTSMTSISGVMLRARHGLGLTGGNEAVAIGAAAIGYGGRWHRRPSCYVMV
jgi:hypothetical protein